MKETIEFRDRIHLVLQTISENALQYNEQEYWMIQRPYEYIEHYAYEEKLYNTAIALPLARGLHNGEYRKSGITKNGVFHKLPYVIHCLLVCRMLVDMHVPLAKEDMDILLSSALCHDMIEDIDFPNGGTELITEYHLHPRVYETVKLLSKRNDFTEQEHIAYFDAIMKDPIALLVKLSDRGNNVEDLYNMSIWKTHEYVGETRQYFFPMCKYAKDHYKDMYVSFEILEDKIVLLTHVAEIMVNRYEKMEKDWLMRINNQMEENHRLKETLEEIKSQMKDRVGIGSNVSLE